ncbi:MAG: hypothetical protein SFY56_13095 [Bacteroidota bacterium]|nr:hypothetical protein [Bacteroidota bacterium]
MLGLIDEIFETRNDPKQLEVNEAVIEKLQQLHPSTLCELANEQGPISWVLIIPTTKSLMMDFLDCKVSENDLLNKTTVDDNFESIYLCSATTLPEFRRKGDTKKMCIRAIKEVCKDFPIKTLYVWPFTREGEFLAEGIAKEIGLPLMKLDYKK